MRIDLAKFTLVGATTRPGLLTTPLRDRFGIPVRLNFYTVEELERVVTRGARVLGAPISAGRRPRDRAARARHAAHRRPPAAPRARLRRRRRRADHRRHARRQGADRARGRRRRPRRLDHRYLSCIAKNYDGGPVGIETLAAALSEPRDALEEIVEPYLLQQGFIGRTPRGRIATLKAYKHLGLSGPQRASSPQGALFDVLDEDTGEDGGKAMRAPDERARATAFCYAAGRIDLLAHPFASKWHSSRISAGPGRQSK